MEKKIYTQNLNTGAGTQSQKTKELRKKIELVTPEQIDFWGWFMWQRFMRFKGGQKALTKGERKLEIEIKPYIKKRNS